MIAGRALWAKLRQRRRRLWVEACRILVGTKAWRVNRCMKYKIPTPTGQPPAMYQHPETCKCYLAGYMGCSLSWVCANCAPKVTEKKRVELQEAILRAKALGWTVVMMTLTFPHHAGMGPRQARRLLLGRGRSDRNGAIHRLEVSKTWCAFKKATGYEGLVRAIEVTDGDNGTHAHAHILLFLSNPPAGGVARFHAGLTDAWLVACRKVGVHISVESESDFRKHALDFKSTDEEVSDYVSKWGAEWEMTKGHTKKGHNGHLSPWDVLDEVRKCRVHRRDPDLQVKYEMWFGEYAEAFHRTRQLFYSGDLRSKLGMGAEKTDEELANEPENAKEWKRIYEFQDSGDVVRIGHYAAKGSLESVAERWGLVGIERVLSTLRRIEAADRADPPPPRAREPGFEAPENFIEVAEADRSDLKLKINRYRLKRNGDGMPKPKPVEFRECPKCGHLHAMTVRCASKRKICSRTSRTHEDKLGVLKAAVQTYRETSEDRFERIYCVDLARELLTTGGEGIDRVAMYVSTREWRH